MDIKYGTLFYARCRCESDKRNHKLPNKLSFISYYAVIVIPIKNCNHIPHVHVYLVVLTPRWVGTWEPMSK